MSELKKGDLVMTEHGLGFYVNDLSQFPRLRELGLIAGVNIAGQDGLEENGAACKTASPATRPQVDAYLKEKGWKFVKRNNNWMKDDSCFWIKWSELPVPHSVFVAAISHDIFDTAPAQLQESITMARLLNATKP